MATNDEIVFVFRKIRTQAAGDGGFMFAFLGSQPYSIGFNYVSYWEEHLVALSGKATDRGEPLKLETTYMYPNGNHADFLENFVSTTAKLIGISQEDILEKLVRQPNLWRFCGFINGAIDGYVDNSVVWRVLWGRIIESVKYERITTPGIPPIPGAKLVNRLRSCAVSGQIVLER